MTKKEREKDELVSISDMVNYAMEMYGTGKDTSGWYNLSQTWYKAIERALDFLHLKQTGTEHSEGTRVSRIIAELVIDDVMRHYFMGTGTNHPKTLENNRIKRTERKRLELLQELQNQSEVYDKEETEKSWDTATYFAPTSYEDEYYECSYARAQSPEHEAELKEMGFKILSNKAAIPENFLRYSLPRTPLDDMIGEQVDKIVDRTMIRAVFKLFFDFKEQDFRTDLFERAARIYDGNSGEQEYDKGYYALTQILENPMNIYITPKKIKKTNKKTNNKTNKKADKKADKKTDK